MLNRERIAIEKCLETSNYIQKKRQDPKSQIRLKLAKIQKFSLEPRDVYVGNLSGVQKNIISAARSNNDHYLREQIPLCVKSDFEVRDAKGNTPLWQAVSNMH